MHPSLNYYADKHVLITGGAGFIGSHLTDRLLGLGAKVLGVDNLLTGRMKNIAHLYDTSQDISFDENYSFINADVTKLADEYFPDGYRPDIVFHFASPASPPRYQQYPVETYMVNTTGTHNLLQHLKNNAPSCRFVFASTSEVYGDPLEHPQNESYWGNVNPNGVRSCYDESKRMGEAICGVHQREFGLDVRIVRIFNTYGPRMDPLDGRVVPNLINQAISGQPYTIYGDGSQTRSYCFIDDLVEGVLRLGGKAGLSGETINIGTKDEYSVKETAEVVHKFAQGSGSEPQYEYLELPKDDPTRRRPDLSKAAELLEWTPTVSFAEGLKPTVEYFASLRD